MRDFLSYDPVTKGANPGEAGGAFVAHEPIDPVAKARDVQRRILPKRFFAEAIAETTDGGHRILLDGRPVMTPAKRPLVLPNRRLAEVIAAEWAGQGTHIDPAGMPLTRLANSVVDGVAERRAEVAVDAAAYGGSDLLCYRAEAPIRLAERQTAQWDPVLDWIDERHGARFLVADGIMHVAQDPDALERIHQAVAALDVWRLGGLHSITTLTGSVFLALALLDGFLDVEATWNAAHVDEDWNIELWGVDDEAIERRAHRRSEFDAACAVLTG